MFSNKGRSCQGRLIALVAATLMLAISPAAKADELGDFYKGKIVTLYVGYNPGGINDTYARLLERHLPRHLAGSPTVVSKNMPGAGSMVLANYLANVAPKDATVFGAIQDSAAWEPLSNANAKYDGRKFNWLGSLDILPLVCFSMEPSPVKTLSDAKSHELLLSGSNGLSWDNTSAVLANHYIGTKFKLIAGYQGATSFLALERGEVGGRCYTWTGLKVLKPDWIAQNKLNYIVQVALISHPDLVKVPLIGDFVTDPTEKQELRYLLGGMEMGRPFALPPGVPSDRVAHFRQAFAAAAADPAFLAEAEKLNIEILPVTGERIDAIVNDIYQMPAAIIKKAEELKRSSAAP